MAKWISDSFYAFWWQVYFGVFLPGFFSALALAAWARRSHAGYGALLRYLCYTAVAGVLTALLLTLARHYASPWVSVFFLFDHLVGFFVDGAILAMLFPSLLKLRFDGFHHLQLELFSPQTSSAVTLLVGTLYLSAGIIKLTVHETLEFFHASGYGITFFFFIAIWECIWGIGVLLRPTRIVALLALSVEMFGAIYTHYHNYFTKGLAGPFGNSLDALRMLTLMSYIAYASVCQITPEASRIAAEPV